MPPLSATASLTLLSGWHRVRRSDLASHIAHYGPLPDTGGDFSRRFVEAVEASGLVGRGGGGFSAAAKLARHRPGSHGGTVVVNAMEGEPASAKDRVLLSCAPHLVLDGAELAANAVGADRVVLCVPDDGDAAATHVAAAIAERAATARSPLALEVARPPGRYVAGEESALVGWLERGRGLPAFRPDKGMALRLGRAPALVHNAETLAHMALVGRQGTGPPSEDGDGALGTTLVTVSGSVQRPGVFEVPLGIPLRAVIDLAGTQGPLAAALVGGYGGSWVGAEGFDTPFSARGLTRLGASPGAGVVVALSDAACGIAETARIAAYMAAQSAGQCGPCVYGLPAMADDVAALAAGRGGTELVRRLDGRLAAVTGRGACRHPDGVARMVASALNVFDRDVRAHLAGRPCRHRGTTAPVGRLAEEGLLPWRA